jgi:excisionase family DNA binding protein
MPEDSHPPDTKLIPLFVSAAEAASYLGLSRQKVYELLDSGVIDSTRHGTRRLVVRDSLYRYADSLVEQEA